MLAKENKVMEGVFSAERGKTRRRRARYTLRSGQQYDGIDNEISVAAWAFDPSRGKAAFTQKIKPSLSVLCRPEPVDRAARAGVPGVPVPGRHEGPLRLRAPGGGHRTGRGPGTAATTTAAAGRERVRAGAVDRAGRPRAPRRHQGRRQGKRAPESAMRRMFWFLHKGGLEWPLSSLGK